MLPSLHLLSLGTTTANKRTREEQEAGDESGEDGALRKPKPEAWYRLLSLVKNRANTQIRLNIGRLYQKCRRILSDLSLIDFDANAGKAEAAVVKLKETIENTNSWAPQNPSPFAQAFSSRMDDAKMRTLIKAYREVRPLSVPEKTPEGKYRLETSEEEKQIRDKFEELAESFRPLIDASKAFGFAPQDHKRWNIQWRFQGVRHEHAAVIHMDNADFLVYADEMGEISRRWTENHSRNTVTAGCVNMENTDTHHCGTRIHYGVPVMREANLMEAVNAIQKEVGFNCHDVPAIRKWVVEKLMRATEKAIEYFRKDGGKLEDAGIRTTVVQNGSIGTANDYTFHSANRDVPAGYERYFFACSPEATDVHGHKIDFRRDVLLQDGTELMFSSI